MARAECLPTIAGQGASLHLDSYFCPIDVLKEQGHRNVPIYVFEQQPGDFIILPSDCAHQVLNVGGQSRPGVATAAPVDNVQATPAVDAKPNADAQHSPMALSSSPTAVREPRNPGFNLKISWNRTTAESLALSHREVLPRYRAVLKVDRPMECR